MRPPHDLETTPKRVAISRPDIGQFQLIADVVAANPHTIPNPNLIHPGDIVRIPRA